MDRFAASILSSRKSKAICHRLCTSFMVQAWLWELEIAILMLRSSRSLNAYANGVKSGNIQIDSLAFGAARRALNKSFHSEFVMQRYSDPNYALDSDSAFSVLPRTLIVIRQAFSMDVPLLEVCIAVLKHGLEKMFHVQMRKFPASFVLVLEGFSEQA